MSNKTIVVVGASRGIGKALVEIFASNSENRVIALSRDLEKMKELFYGNSNVFAYPFDLLHNVQNEAKTIFEGIGNIDILINNAGKLVNKPFPEITHSDLSECYQVNVIGVMETVQAALPQMVHGGHIVNISSMGGFQGSVKFAGLSAYSTSKAALCSFTEMFA